MVKCIILEVAPIGSDNLSPALTKIFQTTFYLWFTNPQAKSSRPNDPALVRHAWRIE